jgi:hypothetical protein
MHCRAAAFAGAVSLAAAIATPLGAQAFQFKPRTQIEARADAILGSPSAVQLGVGANVPLDYYVRLGAAVAGGTGWQDGHTTGSARVDVTARYLLDPFHESRWGFYGGGGLSARWEDSAHWRPYLLLLGGVEGPASRGWRTAFEAGIGGGVRIGIVLRRARQYGR